MERVKAKAVVSNADLRRTVLELLPPRTVPDDYRARLAATEPARSVRFDPFFMVFLLSACDRR